MNILCLDQASKSMPSNIFEKFWADEWGDDAFESGLLKDVAESAWEAAMEYTRTADQASKSMPPLLVFTVYGTPQPQGSSRAFFRPGMKRPVITSDNPKNKPWRQELSGTAQHEMGELALIERPHAVRVEAFFYFDKPKSTPRAVNHKTTKPDLDKLARSLLDGLTGIVFEDDSQVTQCWVSKFFGSPARAEIRVTSMEEACNVRSAPERCALPTPSTSLKA